MSEDNTHRTRQLILVQRLKETTHQLAYIFAQLDFDLFDVTTIELLKNYIDEAIDKIDDLKTYKWLD
jgi:hypothetical protein